MQPFLADEITPYQINLPAQIKPLVNNAGNFGVDTLAKVIELLLFGGVFLAFGYVIFGGFKWIISQGDPKNIEQARNTILYAAIGLGITILSLLLVNVLGFFFNIPLLNCFINCS